MSDTYFMDEAYITMPDHNQYLDDDHEKLDEALSGWVSRNHYAIRKTIEAARKQRLAIDSLVTALELNIYILDAMAKNTEGSTAKMFRDYADKTREAIKKHG